MLGQADRKTLCSVSRISEPKSMKWQIVSLWLSAQPISRPVNMYDLLEDAYTM